MRAGTNNTHPHSRGEGHQEETACCQSGTQQHPKTGKKKRDWFEFLKVTFKLL